MTHSSPKFEALDWYLSRSVDLARHAHIVFHGGELVHSLSKIPRDRLTFYQTFFPKAFALEQQKFKVNIEPTEPPTLILIALSKSKGANDLALQTVGSSVSPEAEVIIVLESDLGGSALVKQFRKELPDVITESKAHSKIIHCSGKDLSLFAKNSFPRPFEERTITHNGTLYHTHPTLFSWQECDPGSLLLLEVLAKSNALSSLSQKPALHIADFGCGWGLLGIELLKKLPLTLTATFIDSERHALKALQQTLAAPDFPLSKDAIHLIWGDITSKGIKEEFDVILSNLPFHDPTSINHNLQVHFLEAIYHALKPGGAGYLVWHQIPPKFDERPWFQFSDAEILQSKQPYFIISVKK